ncbi:MAG: cytochrome c biogenesis heme-transporting ATPase CcmA [Comamonas sp.]|uniref:cytochrome c biogenesis heme-transporting ATPase CcmA n=1 Tax=Comamonas sp. TaxID=34028 RepID=UPI00281BD8FB|nr:cytochrome c biogenesis heme-transporting ATPase CcmA [Comamonas sp.]MDR0217105.1 cytochrome c biogenesis heme-transporting ATPase CcmA [Comamonas sp.]
MTGLDTAASRCLSRSISVSGLGCVRGGRVLLRDLGLELAAGQLLMLRGHNGAGKSSLLRCLAGLLPWRAGCLQWCGKKLFPRDAGYQRQLAYMGHQAGMSDALTGLENLRFSLDLMAVGWNDARVQAALHALSLAEVAARPFGRLSQGQRRRLSLARVLLCERPLWLLDEPDNCLDAQGEQYLGEALEQHLAAGGMAVVASHRNLALPTSRVSVLDLSQPVAARNEQVAVC